MLVDSDFDPLIRDELFFLDLAKSVTCKFLPTFERVEKDRMCFLRVGIIDKDESFSACFSQLKASKENSESGDELPKTTRVLQ